MTMTEPTTTPLAEDKLARYELLPTVIRRQAWGAVEDAADAIRTLTAEVRRLRRRPPCGEALCDNIERDQDNYEAQLDQMQGLLGSIWLYVGWRSATRSLTTEQREMWADAVDAKCRKGQIEDGEEPHPVAERWWRDDFVEGSNG